MADEVAAATPATGTAPQAVPQARSRDEQNSLEFATRRIAGLIGADEPTETPRDEPAPPSDDAAEPGSTAEDEGEQPDTDAEPSDSESEAEPKDDAPAELPSTLDELVAAYEANPDWVKGLKTTIKVDGEDVEVTLAEALQGYSRTQDYTRKTTELSEAKADFAAQAERVEAELRSKAERFSVLTGMLEKQLTGAEPNWQKLLAEDPQGYLKAKHDWEQRTAVVKNAVAERDRLFQQQSAQHQAKIKEFVEAERQKMVTNWPELADHEGPAAKKARDYLQARGFSKEDIAGLVDHRMIGVVMDAIKTWETQQATPEKKLQKPKPTRTVKPGAKADGVDAKTDRLAVARRNHRKNPKDLHAAAARLEALLSS